MDPRVEAQLKENHDKQSGMDWIVNRVLQQKPEHRSEISRICSLPIAQPLSDEEIAAINQIHVKPDAYADGFRLQRVQAESLQIFTEMGTVFAPIEVGGGKTLICLRCLGIAFEEGLSRAVLVVPSQVYSQLTKHDINWAKRRVGLGMSFYLMGGKNPQRRRELAGGRRGCWVLTYSLLSRPDSFDLLEMIKPELMIFDEAHNLKRRESARTRRILTYWKKHRPRVMCTSGTMTAKSLRDYAHLLTMCLGIRAPIPSEANVVQEWAATLDSEQAQTEQFHKKTTSAGPLRPLINWSNKQFPSTRLSFDVPGFRQAFQNRLLTAPGVVSSPADSLGTSIIIENIKADCMAREGGAALQEHIQRLNTAWVSPSGDELEHAMLVWKWNNELSAGIYNSLVWPDAGQLATKRGITIAAAEDLLKRSQDYHCSLQRYHKELRSWFSKRGHIPNLDTPMLVAGSMFRFGSEKVGKELFEAWSEKESLDFEGRVERLSVPVRVCDYKIKLGIDWTNRQDNRQGILFYHHQEVGVWMSEALTAAGIDNVHCPAGEAANRFLTDEGAAERCKNKFLVCSLSAHGTGKNLQFMTNQCFLQMPITEMATEQAIGRTHRKGQEADEVVVTTMVSNDHDELALAAILNDAIYVRETMNSPRKVLIATWDPMPSIYGSQILIRAGAQAKILTARQQQLLRDRFTSQES